MSILDLTARLTDDESRFGEFKRSSDSLILIRPRATPDGSSVDLSVGDCWFDCEKERDYRISDEGLELRPGGFAVIESQEEVALPHNVFGLLTGKGVHIFRGIMISPGKIDPTFRDRLRIGVFNAGRATVTFKRGEALCSCCFLSLESESRLSIPRKALGPRVMSSQIPFTIRFGRRMRDPIVIIMCTVLTALATLLSAVFAYLAVHTKH
jgi:deoxycytidine triphosphate deaminase